MVNTNPIRVIALDDHHLIRAGIRSLLTESEHIELVGEGWAGEHLAPLMATHHPDIVLLDLKMPAREGPEGEVNLPFRTFPAISILSDNYPDTRILVISQYASPAAIEGALQSGVRGFLLKDDALSLHLIEAIQCVYRGGFYLSGEVSRQLSRLHSTPVKMPLTGRQEEVIQSIAANPDWSYGEHARRLGISENTFSNHLRHIFERLEVNNITAAVVKAIEIGIVTVPVQYRE